MTEEEIEYIITEVTNRITRSSVGIDEVPVIDTVDDINTLPCSTADGTIVLVKVDTLARPAIVAAEAASRAAQTATAASLTATTTTKDISAQFDSIKEEVQRTIQNCSLATDRAITASDNIGNKKILVVTEDLYAALLNGEAVVVDDILYSMDNNTLYFVTES